MPSVTVGQEFDSLADFKAYLREWAVEDGFSPAILDSDARRVRVGCRTAANCPFRIRCNFDQTENKAKVTILVANHTCQEERDPENTSVIRGEVTKLRFLLNAVPQLMVIEQATPTKDIIENVKNRYGQQISIRQAQKVKATLLSMASENLGRDLSNRMKQKLSNDAREEEMREGKRLRMDEETIDPRLYDDGDYQDDDLDDYENDYDDDYVDQYDPRTGNESGYDNEIGDDSRLESDFAELAPSYDEPTSAELRAEAAALFQQASKKFQEATQLHMQASRLFSQATEIEKHLG